MLDTRLRVLTAGLLLTLASTSSATQFPNPGCPDSVTIRRIQDVTAACHPILGDTVRGVGGIIIGFDPIATGFDAYIQTSGGGPFTGVDFFTHSLNTKAAPYNFALGDSIVVEFAAVSEFQSATEVLATNNNFGAPNFVVRKVSSGNTLPPFFSGTSTQLRETSTNTFFEQYEGCLVKVSQTGSGSLKVARTSLTGGLGQNNAFLLVDSSAPSDSVFVDGNKLTSFGPPAVGTPIVSVQGVGNQATRGYRIMLRSGNDIIANTPPNVTNAYPVDDTHIKVVFDRDVTTGTATNTGNYSLASFGSVTAASMITQHEVLLTINNGLAHGDLETVTVNGVASLTSGQTMTTPESRTFVNGVLSVAEVRAPDPDSLAATTCSDRSRFAGPGATFGPTLTVEALCAASMAGVSYLADTTSSNVRTGLAVAGTGVDARGEFELVAGNLAEEASGSVLHTSPEAVASQPCIGKCPKKPFCILLGCRNQICFYICITIGVGADDALAQALRNTSCDAAQSVLTGRDYESAMVGFGQLRVLGTAIAGSDFQALPTDNTTDTVTVMNESGAYTYAPHAGDIVSVAGVVVHPNGRYAVAPRDDDDIVFGGTSDVPGTMDGQLSFSAFPNPSRSLTVTFTLPQLTKVDLSIFDVTGRLVRTLLHSDLVAGLHTETWSGRDAAMLPVAPGLYTLRLQAGERTLVVKHIVLE